MLKLAMPGQSAPKAVEKGEKKFTPGG